jgi:plastocyanin
MRFEHWLIGVMIFLVAGVLGLIAASPDDVTVPKSTQTSIEVTESISISEPISSEMPAPGIEEVPEMIVVEESEAQSPSEVTEEVSMLPSSAEVNIPEGSGVPGCEEKKECFIPFEVSIAVGGEVIWNNGDTAAHTVTSGNPSDGPDGVFDSSLFMAGKTFSHTFDEAGTYEYFCMVHPWMTGTIQVS